MSYKSFVVIDNVAYSNFNENIKHHQLRVFLLFNDYDFVNLHIYQYSIHTKKSRIENTKNKVILHPLISIKSDKVLCCHRITIIFFLCKNETSFPIMAHQFEES